MMFPTQEGQLGTFLPSKGTGRGHLRPREVPLNLTPLTRKGWGRPLRGVQVNGPEGIMFTRCLQRRTWGLGLRSEERRVGKGRGAGRSGDRGREDREGDRGVKPRNSTDAM